MANFRDGFPGESYLTRIGLTHGEIDAADDRIGLLAGAQYAAVPFENLQIHQGVPVRADAATVLRRTIDDERGGICYDLNGTLHLALAALGLRTELVGAQVDSGDGFGPELGHVALVVPSGDSRMRLVDVGFGGEMIDAHIDLDDPSSLVIDAGGARYLIDPRFRALDEFDDMARWHSTSPRSRFTQSLICTLPTHGGRRTLAGRIDPQTREIVYREIGDFDGTREGLVLVDEEVSPLLFGLFGIRGGAPKVSVLAGQE
ncbi:MAG: arylamine N-acetyltransferase [Gordonia sp. (in: high G+C Gram-positive bacteria)]